MIIDVHAHIGGSWLGFFDGVDADGFVKIMDKYGVDKACISSWQHLCDPIIGNNDVFEAMQKYPNRIIGFCVLCPRLKWDMGEEIDRCVQKGMKGIGELHPAANEFYADSTLVDPILEKARQYKIPVLFHSDSTERAHPRLVGNVAKRHPDVTIIIGHSGLDTYHEAIQVAKANPNVLLDTTEIPNVANIIELFVKNVGAERVVWGSDTPAFNTGVEMAKVKLANISQKEKDMILGENIARILGL